ncbi:hypothetical protein JL722_11983 [Aureococcus anophagefferens]|nr:hypothetical protein JL722_11983 [Aureococcus anophagefferens]
MLGMLLLSLHSITAAPVLVLVPAANRSFAADAYAALAQALVGRGVDARVADVSDTAPASVIAGVTKALANVSHAFVLAGHGDGGDAAEALGYANATVGGRLISGVALLGACVPRAHYAAPAPNGTTPPSTRDHPAPVLTVAGSLDGVSRATRAAEAWYRQAGSDDDPVLVVEGLNHAQFADGRPLDGDLAADLEPAAAIAAVADAVAAFALDAPLDLAATAKFVAPLVAAMELEGSPYLRAPCQSDWPTNPRARTAMARRVTRPRGAGAGPAAAGGLHLRLALGGPRPGHHERLRGERPRERVRRHERRVRGRPDVRPFHLPHIFNACDSNDTDCVLESTTVTMPIHSLRGDYGPVAASEFRTKLKSRQAMWQAYGLDASDDNATDATSLNTCAHINAAAIAWAKAARACAGALRSRRATRRRGRREAPIGLTGPTWIKTPPVFRRNDSGVDVTSYSFTIANVRRGDVPFFITAGFHYCKLLSPLKAMEWIYVDGLPRVGAAARAAACERCVDRRDPVNASFAAAHCWLDDGCYAVGDAANPCAATQCASRAPLSSCACGGCDDLFCTF